MDEDVRGDTWATVETELLHLATSDIAKGVDPRPVLLAYAGDRAIAVVRLRPFTPAEVVQPLVEILALLLPLGADRLALAAPARAWSSEDPIAPVCDEGDLRQRVLLVMTADGTTHPCEPVTSLHPFPPPEDGAVPCFGPPLRPHEPAPGPVASALATLLDGRHDLRDLRGRSALAAQFGRVLLLGHELALAEGPAQRLLVASSS